MKCYLVLVLALFQYSDAFSLSTPKPFSKPPFCYGLECPEYEIKMKTADFEERCYTEYKWASTNESDIYYDPAAKIGFDRLFEYYYGTEDEIYKMGKAAPVAVEIKPGKGPFCPSNFTVNFFLPYKYQKAGPPKPKAEKVYISTIPKRCQYVASYPGFSTTALMRENAGKLMKALAEAGLGDSYDKSSYYFAWYDNPLEMIYRHNEIWLIKKDETFGA